MVGCFQHPLRGPHREGLSLTARVRSSTRLYCSALRAPALTFRSRISMDDAGTEVRESVDTSILENCIEKNFHVPNMKSGPPAEGGCNFE